jgi:hypothetical protein
MKKIFLLLVILFVGSKLYSQPPNWPYVEGPETGVVGTAYTYSVGGPEIDTAYSWTLYGYTGILFADSIILSSNLITLTFPYAGRYFLVSDHGYDLEINISSSDIVNNSIKLFKSNIYLGPLRLDIAKGSSQIQNPTKSSSDILDNNRNVWFIKNDLISILLNRKQRGIGKYRSNNTNLI